MIAVNMTSMDDIITGMTTEDPFSSSATTEDDYDYGEVDNISNLMCDRQSVRDFRSRYEPPFFWIITLVGGAGNLAVVWIYLSFRKRLKTMTDVYLLNLAVADLLFLVTLPLWAAEASHGWIFGPAMCKINSALYKVNLFSSIMLLTCISVDRYIVIVQTTKAQNSQMERRRCSRLVCAGVWLLALLLAVPELSFAVPANSYCRMVYPSNLGNRTKILVLSLQVSMGFFIPFMVMAFCYSVIIAKLLKTRNFEKHKAMRVILAVVVVFIVSQLPYNSMLVMEATQASNMTVTDCEKVKAIDMASQVLKSIAYMHACLNPFLYVFVGVRFRRDIKRLLHCCLPQSTKTPLGKTRSPLSSTRISVMSDSDTSHALSL
ncbi:C-C chemokine receptor type 9a [Cyprinodon tularosa]|uniref:C-C chemokine receptor type 9a n=1 Tax=Cyprinodon tularosa TaxID=77115 RepID=UPI0018E27890|nr:C-C chemokine receptor type 9a [Cyprinodon tularosa]XP_038131322.1 C-C chemokine receptor type 9a [Cyprinodon tularosa]